MIKSLNRAEDAMVMQQLRIDAMANNLANVNTTGFKQMLTRAVQRTDSPAPAGGRADGQEALPVDARTGIEARPGDLSARTVELVPALDTRSGQIRSTGRELDVAVMGRGWFVVQTDEGNRYTRDGSFILDSEKRLMTPSGGLVQGTRGPITIDGDSFAIEHDGTITVGSEIVGSLRLVDFEDASRLEHLGNSLMVSPEDMTPTTVPVEEVVVAQGHLEGSNVSAIDTLVAMIAAQRAFEVQAKVLTTEDGLLDKAVNTLSRAGRS